MALPVDYQTCRVTGRWVNNDAPDYTPAVGHIRFLPHATRIVSAGTETVVLPGEIVAFLDDSGEIDIEIPATNDPDITPLGFTYRVIEVVDRGTTYDIEAPWDQDIDLSTVVGVEADDGATIIIGPTGPPLLVKGTVANYAALPGTPTVGDVYLTDDDGHAYQWTGTTWLDIGAFNFVADPAANVAGARTLGDGALQAAPGDAVVPGIDGAARLRSTGLDSWFTALDAAATTAADVVVIGDSISSSFIGGNTVAEDLWPWQLEAALARIVPHGDPVGYRFAQTTGGTAGAPGITSTAGAAAAAATAAWGSTLTAGQKATFTADMDGVSLVYTRGTGTQQITARDGVGGTMIGTIAPTGAARSGIVWTSAALTAGAHTIEVENTGATSVVIDGMYAHNGNRASGVRVWNASHEGFLSSYFTAAPSIGLDLVTDLDPSLTIIATGTNDDPGNYDSRVRALVAAVQSRTTGSVALLIPPISDDLTGPGAFTAAEAVLGRQIAADLDIGLIDCTRTIGEHATNGLGSSTDGLHPNLNGQQMVTATVLAAVGGNPLGSQVTLAAPKGEQRWNMSGTARMDLDDVAGIPVLTLRENGKAQDYLQLTRFFGLYPSILAGDGTTAPETMIRWVSPGQVGIPPTLTVGGLVGRHVHRVITIASSAAPTVNSDNAEAVTITGQTAAITSMSSGLTGTPVDFQRLVYRIKDNGTARTIAWGAKFTSGGVALPTTTVANKVLRVDVEYDTVSATWRTVTVLQEP